MIFYKQLFGGGGGPSGLKHLNFGHQGKHWTWHDNYIQERSIIYLSSNEIQDLVGKYSSKNHGQREYKDFGKVIGKWYNIKDGKYYDTTRGTIHWDKNGGYHIVPAPPSWFLN